MKIEIDGRETIVHAIQDRRRIDGQVVIEGVVATILDCAATVTFTSDEWNALIDSHLYEEYEAHKQAVADLRRTARPWPWSG